MRDILLSATAGFLCSCGGAFAVHRALWKAADAHGQELDALVGNTHGSDVSSSIARRRVSVLFLLILSVLPTDLWP